MKYPPGPTCAQPEAAGFSILELLVVLLLLAFISALAIPRITALYDSVTYGMERDDVLNSLAGLGYAAYARGKAFSISRQASSNTGGAIPLKLPEGWTVAALNPISYSMEGICSGGAVTLEGRGRTLSVELEPPLCRPKLENDKNQS